jgi:hypothetical protein
VSGTDRRKASTFIANDVAVPRADYFRSAEASQESCDDGTPPLARRTPRREIANR